LDPNWTQPLIFGHLTHPWPVLLVVGLPEQAETAVERHLERFPQDQDREMTVIITGVPRADDDRGVTFCA
jgi:hypothetical protein